jgi:hypothetical protein
VLAAATADPFLISNLEIPNLRSQTGWVRLVILFSRGDAEDAESRTLNLKLGTLNWRVERMGSFGTILINVEL